jgi:hypothetical protein
MKDDQLLSTKTTTTTATTTPSRFVKRLLLNVVAISLIMYSTIWHYHLVPHFDDSTTTTQNGDLSFHPPPVPKRQQSQSQRHLNSTRPLSSQNSDPFTDTKPETYSSITPMPSLSELTQNPPEGSIQCRSPYMVPIYDKVVPNEEGRQHPKIPRIIHVSFNRRCVPDELAYNIAKWQESLPNYSFYFHDDDAVQRLLSLSRPQPPDSQSSSSPMAVDFPNLHNLLNCVKYKGAMKIDIWRILVTYYYGGLYTDIDVTPGSSFNSQTIKPDDTFFTLTDGKDRPSQWLFGMSPHHLIGQLTMEEIQRRLLRMRNIAKPRVVAITGPQALKSGYNRFMVLKNRNQLPVGDDKGGSNMNTMRITKVPAEDRHLYASSKRMDDVIDFDGKNLTVREKIETLSGIVHWPDEVNQNRSGIPYEGVSCVDYLAQIRNNVGETTEQS